MSRDPFTLYLFFLCLQLAAGAQCARCKQPMGPACVACCAANIVELQHEIGRRTPMSAEGAAIAG